MRSQVLLLRCSDARLSAMRSPPSDGHKHLHKRGSEHEAELRKHLQCEVVADGFSCAASASVMARLADMISFVPASAVLRESGVAPTLLHHRFVILHGKGVLRTVTTGYFGASQRKGNDMPAPTVAAARDTRYRLTAVSPNLLQCGTCADQQACIVQYMVTERAPPSIDEEVAKAAPGWVVAYGQVQ